MDGSVRYNQYLDASRRVDSFGDISKIQDPVQYRRALDALADRNATRAALHSWRLTMLALDRDIPNAVTH